MFLLNRYSFLGGVVIFSLFVGWVIYMYPFEKKDIKNQEKPFLVELISPKKMNIPIVAKVYGRVITPKRVSLTFERSGIIDQIPVYSGEQVRKGQLLFQLLDKEEDIKILSAQSQFLYDQLQYKRYTQLKNTNSISTEQYESIKNRYLQSQASLILAKKDKRALSVKAPFSGRLTVVHAVKGHYVTMNDVLTELVNTNDLEVEYELDEKLLPYVKLNNKITVFSIQNQEEKFNATISYISPVINKNPHTVTVRAKISNINQQLLPGALVTIEQIVKNNNEVLTVPMVSLLADKAGYYVYLFKDNKAVKRAVQLGNNKKGWIAINASLNESDRVVVSGQHQLWPGRSIITKTDTV